MEALLKRVEENEAIIANLKQRIAECDAALLTMNEIIHEYEKQLIDVLPPKI